METNKIGVQHCWVWALKLLVVIAWQLTVGKRMKEFSPAGFQHMSALHEDTVTAADAFVKELEQIETELV